MKKVSILSALFLLIFIYQNLSAGKPDLPVLLINNTVNQNTIGWQWRIVTDNKIYPYLRIEINQLFFLDSDGNVIHRTNYLPQSKVVTSNNQAFVGFIDLDEQSKNPGDQEANRGVHYHITKYSGEEIYSIPLEVPYDDPIPALYLVNDGRSVLADGYKGIVKIIGSDGMLVQEIDLFDDDILDYEKPIACAIADNGDKLAILAQNRPMSFDSNLSTFVSGEPHLFCFSLDGKKILNKLLELMSASELAISHSGNFIVVSQYTPEQEKKSSIINLNGEIVLEIPTLFRYAQFYRDESLLVLADRKSFFNINLEKKQYSMKTLIQENENRMIVDILLAEWDNELFMLTAESVFQNNRFEFIKPGAMKFDQNGDKIWTLEFEPDKFITPSIYINQDHLALGFESTYKVYKEHGE